MKKFNVVATNKLRQPLLTELAKDYNIQMRTKETEKEAWESWLKEADALYSPSSYKIDEELLQKSPRLKVISQVSVGYDNIDIEACLKRGILVGHTPGVVTDATADMALGLILCSARYLQQAWLHVKSGEWGQRKPFTLGTDLKNKQLGIIGMGSVGIAVAERAKACGMKIVYHNRKPSEKAEQLGAKYLTQAELLQTSDFIILNLPLNEETKGMFGEKEFAQMKPTARFINAARGPIVQTDALYNALKNGVIAYAALDVTDPEPLPGDHPLLSLSNIVIFPHIGGYTEETREAMNQLALENLRAGLAGEKMPACVNCQEK